MKSRFTPRRPARRASCGLVSPQVLLLPLFIFAALHTAHGQHARPVARLVATTSSPVLIARITKAESSTDAPRVLHGNKPLAREIAPVNGFKRTLASLNVTSDERRLFDLINDERAKINLPALEWDAGLVQAARTHTGDMASVGKLSHTGSDMSDAATRVRSIGVRGWSSLAENVAFNQGFEDPVAFVVERWMQSPKHRANISNPTWTHSGIAVARNHDGSVYFTQLFMQR